MKSPIIITFFSLISTLVVHAQLSVGNSTTKLDNFDGGDTSFQHTVTSTSNSLLVVTVAGDLTNPSVSGVTFGGTSLTRAVAFANTGGNAEFSEIWYLFAPTVGEATVEVDLAATGKGYNVAVMDFGNIVQDTLLGTDGSFSANAIDSETLTFDLSSANHGALLIGALDNKNSSDSTPPAGTVQVIDDHNISTEFGGATTTTGYQNIAAGAISSSYDWTWTWTNNDDYAISGAAFAVIPEPNAYALLMGVSVLALVACRRCPKDIRN